MKLSISKMTVTDPGTLITRPKIIRAVIRKMYDLPPIPPFVRSNDYLKFDGVASYGQFERDVVIPAGDAWTLKVNVLTSETSMDQTIVDTTLFNVYGADGYALVYLDAPDGLQFLLGIAESTSFDRLIFGGLSDICNGQYNEIEFVCDGANLSAHLNGVQLGATIAYPQRATTIPVGPGGGLGGGAGRNLNGILANIYIKNLTTGQVLADCHIDQQGLDTQPNRADPTNNLQLFNVDHANDWVEGPL